MRHIGPEKVVSITEAKRRRDTRTERPVTKAEIARHFGVSERTIDRWMRDRGLPFEKPFEGGSVSFVTSVCDDWFAT